MNPPKANAATSGKARGVQENKKADNFHLQEYRLTFVLATHFHDVKSGSVEPLCFLGEAF